MNLGPRIQYFRQRAGLSQFELENAIEASQGSMSRIEHDTINPTKETIFKICEVLKLNDREQGYLLGAISKPATKIEIDTVVDELGDYLNDRFRLAYISDERWRMLAVSKLFKDLLLKGESEEAKQAFFKRLYDKTIIQILLDDSLGITQFFNKEALNELIPYQLKHYWSEMYFMVDDPYYLNTIETIKSHPIASKYWREIETLPIVPYDSEKRYVKFKVGPFNLNFKYFREPISFAPRFAIVEYTPVNKLIKEVMKMAG